MKRKIFISLFIAFLLLTVYAIKYIQDTPVTSRAKPEAVGLLKGPTQTSVDLDDFLYEKGKFEGSVIDHYKIDAKVLAITVNEEYSNERRSPIDIGLIWGEVANSDYNQYMKCKHAPNSEYSFLKIKIAQTLIINWKENPPNGWTTDYVMEHITNNHIFPANENVYRALARLKKKQKVILEGYILSANADRIAEIESHIGHYDPDDYPCKNFYVKKVQVGDKVYE